MPTNDVRRDEIRKILLSLLLARPGTTPLPVLDRDYYDMEGERIPYRKFGYADLLEFLNSMPEYFAIERRSGMHHVRGIASEKTKHVSSLVSRQKSAPPKLKYIPPQFRRTYQPFVSRMPHITQMQRQRFRVPAENLQFVVAYVLNHPNGVTLEDIMQTLRNKLPYLRLNPNDVREQLRELPHFVFLDYDRIYPAKRDDCSREANNHPQPPTSEPRNVGPSRSPAIGAVYVGGDEGSDILEEFSDEDSFVKVNHTSNNHPRQSNTSERLAASFARNAMFNHNDDIDVDEYLAATNNVGNGGDTTTADYGDLSLLIHDRTKSRLDQLVRKYPEGIWCADLPEKYLKEYNVPLNYSELGFPSVLKYVSCLPNIFYVPGGNSTEDFLLYSADKRPTVPDQESTRSEPIEIKPSSREQYDEHNAVRTQHGDDDAPIPADVSPTITKTFAPDDVMNYNDSVDHILVTDLQRDRKYLEVYIVDIFNPSFFWIHLRENKRRFDAFMDELHAFYEYNKDKYTIPKIALKKGLNCACIYAGRWHRGIIRSVKPDFKVTVMFYDYGTLKMYAPEDVYYLHKQFSFLSAQAIPCGLYNVRPCVGDRWKKSVVDQLVDKISETLLALTITSVDPSNNSMMVILSDTSEDEDVHINVWLINENLARRGKMGDAVDMASIMKYVVTNFNQLPTYCFAEESLMSDSRCKATSTEEMHEKVPLVPSKQTHVYHDGLEQHSLRPPPGFAPLGEKPSQSNMSTKSFSDMYSSESASNAKTSSYGNAEVTTNPFLSDQQFVNDNVIPNDIANQIFTPVWNENVQLFIRLTKILCDMIERSPLNRTIFENHMIIQYHLNKFLKGFEKTLIPDNDQSTTGMSSASVNLARETMPDKVGSAEKTPINSNAESFVNQNLAGMMSNLSLSNPFDDDRSHPHNTFSAYGSNGYSFTNNWHQSGGFSPHVQVPSPEIPISARSMFTNCGPLAAAANIFFPNADQGSENASATKPMSPVIPMNASVSNFFSTVNSEFKDTNPFKFPIINDMQIPEKQNERMAKSHDPNPASYLSVKNLLDHSLKMEATNARSNSFMAAEHVNVNSAENYTPRIVYEAGPVMYNTQKKPTDADMKHSASNGDFKNDRNVPFQGHCDNKELSSANDITTLYSKYDNSHFDEGYVTRPPTDYKLQNSPPIISGEPNYHQQNGNVNEQIVSPQTWKQVEIHPEHWINSQFRNGVPLQNHNEKSTISTSINLSPHKDWNCNNNREPVTRGMSGMVDLSYIFQWNDKDRPIDMCNNFLNNPSYIENQNQPAKPANSDLFFDISFVFQKIDSVKNATFVFHTDGEGWMLTHEFVQTFTNLKLCSRLMAMLEATNVRATFKEIQRSDYPVQFLQLDPYPLNVPRDCNKRIVSIHLISLQAALSLLHKLKIVTREEIDNAFKKREFLDSSVLPDMWTLILVYRKLKRRIEQWKLWYMNA